MYKIKNTLFLHRVHNVSEASNNEASFVASLNKKTLPRSVVEDKDDARSKEKVLQPTNQLNFEEKVIENEMIEKNSTKNIEQNPQSSNIMDNNFNGSYISYKYDEVCLLRFLFFIS